jgi:5'-3' exonuclease
LAVAWDRKEPTFRKIKYKKYQSHRPPTDKKLSSQFGKIRIVLETFSVSQFDKKGFEADDIIGTLSKNSNTDEVIIVTGDKDQLQLVDNKIKVFMPQRGLSNGKLHDAKEVKKKLGVTPGQVVDLKAFMGDQSDNYPGIYGIGPKTAQDLLGKYETYHEVFENIDKLPDNLKKKLKEGKKDGDMSYMLAEIVTDLNFKVDEKELGNWNIGNEETIKLFEEFGFKTLTRRIQGKSVKRINSNPSKNELEKVVNKVSKILKGKNFAFRGTVSLVLQGFDMGVDDIDVLTDKKTALNCNELLKEYLYEKVEYKKSDKYKSYFGKFVIDKILVEVYGEWQIKIQNPKVKSQKWSKAFIPSDNIVTEVEIGGNKVKATKPEHELEIVALEGRWNAYHKLKKQVEEKNQQSLF